MTTPAATEITVQLGFGFGPGDVLDDDDWTDVTQWLDADVGSVVVETSSGRDRPDAGITPGRATIRLENLDGRFDPRNTAGPYYGGLNIGTPVRIQVNRGGGDARYGTAIYGTDRYSSETETRWQGFVAGGFPQQFTDQMRTVVVDCHDLFGLIAQGDPPPSALAAYIAGLADAPAHYWQPTASGWVDAAGGLLARHSGGLAELAPTVNGDETSFGSVDADGWGTVDDPAGHLDASSESITVAARVRFPTAAQRRASTSVSVTQKIVVLEQNEPGGLRPFRLEVVQGEVVAYVHTATHRRTGTTQADIGLFDGQNHTIVVHAPAGSGALRCWIDGVEMVLTQVSIALAGSIDPGPLYIGHQDPFEPTVFPYQEVIDPVVIWRGYSGDVAELAAGVHDAARWGWAGQMLDQRAVNLVTAAGLAGHIGPVDGSGVLTLQSYRPRDLLELLQTVEDTEQGRLWVDRLGRFRFSSRGWAWTDAVSTGVQATITDDPDLIDAGAVPLGEGSTLTDSPLDLVNVALVNSEFGRQQRAEDAASIAVSGRRNPVQLSNLLHPSDRQSLAIAQWLVYSQADQPVRAPEVFFDVEANPAVCGPLAQQLDQGWLVRVVKSPEFDCDGDPIGDPVELIAHVTGVRHLWTHLGLRVGLTLDSTRAGRSWFAWDDSAWDDPDAPWAF